VYNAADEGLGNVNDIVLDKDSRLEAMVIGVGGFLGIGEKNVAVSMAAIDRMTDAEGNVKLVLDATAEELDAAPAFVTIAELKRQQELATQPPAGPAGTAPAPAM
ncbi:MAG: PRC-barrel domain-containing protein, partial [Bauldia sp.]